MAAPRDAVAAPRGAGVGGAARDGDNEAVASGERETSAGGGGEPARPDLARLVAEEAGAPPRRRDTAYDAWADEALRVALDGSLPLAATSEALGTPNTTAWRAALVEEVTRQRVREATVAEVAAALGPDVRLVGRGSPAWRPSSGRDLDLLVEHPRVPIVAGRLATAGFVPVPAHDEPGRRVLVRCEGGRAVDLVDLEGVDAADLTVGEDGWAEPTAAAARARLLARAAARGSVRLVDRADAEVLEIPMPEVDPPSASRRDDRVPPPPRVLLTGPGARPEAERLAGSLRVAALDVALVDRRGPVRVLRGHGRRLRDRAVPVFVGAPPWQVGRAVRAEVGADGLSDDDAVALLRRVLDPPRRSDGRRSGGRQADGRSA